MGFLTKALAIVLLFFVLNTSWGQELAGYDVDLVECQSPTGISTRLIPIYVDGRYTYYLTRESKNEVIKNYISKRDRSLKEVSKSPFNEAKFNNDLDNRFWDKVGYVDPINATISADGSTLNVFMLFVLNESEAELFLVKYNTKDLTQKSSYKLAKVKGYEQTYRPGLSSVTAVNKKEGWVAIAEVDEEGNVSYKRFNDNGEVIGEVGFQTPNGAAMYIDQLTHTAAGQAYMLVKMKKYGTLVLSFDPTGKGDIKINDLGMKEGTVYSMPEFVAPTNNKMYLVGMYASKDLERPKGYYLKELSHDRASESSIVHIPFDKTLLSFLETGENGKKVKNGEPFRFSIEDVIEADGMLYVVSSVQWVVYTDNGTYHHQYETGVSRIDLNASTLKAVSTGFLQKKNAIHAYTTDMFMWVDKGTLYIVRTEHTENLNNKNYKEYKRIKYGTRSEVGLALTVVPESGDVKSYRIPGTIEKGYLFENKENIPGSEDMVLTLFTKGIYYARKGEVVSLTLRFSK